MSYVKVSTSRLHLATFILFYFIFFYYYYFFLFIYLFIFLIVSEVVQFSIYVFI